MNPIASLLAAAGRPPWAPADPTPPADIGNFGDLLSDMWARQASTDEFLGGSAAQTGGSGTSRAPSTAELFDEHGLLGTGAVASTPPVTAPVAHLAVAPSEASANDMTDAATDGPAMIPCRPSLSTPVPLVSTTVASRGPGTAAALLSPLAPASPPAIVLASSIGGGATAAPASPSVPPITGVPFRPTPIPQTPFSANVRTTLPQTGLAPDDAPSPRKGPFPDDVSAGASQSDVQITFAAYEPEASVVLRATDLPPGDRARLRERITSLLARFGLRTRDLRVNGIVVSETAQSRAEEA